MCVWCLESIAGVPIVGECVSEKLKKRKKSGLSHSFCTSVSTGAYLHTLSPHPRLPWGVVVVFWSPVVLRCVLK